MPDDHRHEDLTLAAAGILTLLQLLLTREYSVRRGPRVVTGPLLATPHASLPHHPRSRVGPGLGSRLSPVHFHCSHSREVRYYALLGGWLLPSLPPSCLRAWTYFVFTFGRHLGTLTRISVVPVSAQSLIARRPCPRVYAGRHFGVCERGEDFTPQPSRAVLYTPSLLVAGYPVRYFGRNEQCPYSFGFLPLDQSHESELHVSTSSDFHAPLGALHLAPAKIVRLRVSPPRLGTGCSIPPLAAHPPLEAGRARRPTRASMDPRGCGHLVSLRLSPLRGFDLPR